MKTLTKLFLFLALVGSALAQAGSGAGQAAVFGPYGGGGGGSGTVTSVSWTGGIVSIATPTTTPAFTIAGTSGGIPYFSSASTWASSAALADNVFLLGGGAGNAPTGSLLSDDGTTATYTGTGGLALTGGSVAGTLELAEGTAPSVGTTSIKFYAPTSVTSHTRRYAGVAATGFSFWTNTAGDMVETIAPFTGAGNVVLSGSPTLTGAPIAPTASVGTNTTQIATAAFANAAALASRLGSYGTPNTAGGAVTWIAPVYEVFTNTTTPYALPAAAGYDGRAVIFYVVGTNAVTIDPNGSEVIVRDGTAQTGGVTMTLTGEAGNYVCLVCDGTRWVSLGYKGTLAEGS